MSILRFLKKHLPAETAPVSLEDEVPEDHSKVVSVVLATFQRKEFLVESIATIRRELECVAHEIIVVDGGSTDGSLEWLAEQKDILLLVQHNRGEFNGRTIPRRTWGYFISLGFKCATGKYVCMLSDDCLVIPGAIRNGIDVFDKALEEGRKVGAVAFYFRDWPLRMEYAVANNLDQLYVNHGLYLNDALREVGYANEDDFKFYYADTDLVLKMVHEGGYECLDSPTSFIEHYVDEGEPLRIENNRVAKRDLEMLLQRWQGRQFPEEKTDHYRANIGYWSNIDPPFEDPGNTASVFERLKKKK